MLPLLFGIGLIPWLIILAVSIIITIANEFDENRYATGSLAIGTGLVLWIAHINPLPFLAAHGGLIAAGVLGYFIVGIIWGFFKWYLFNHDIVGRINAKDLTLHSDVGSKFVYWRGRNLTVPLDPTENKTRIVGWMTYWPWSIVWFILNDPVRRAWNTIYNHLASKFTAISNHVAKKLTVKGV